MSFAETKTAERIVRALEKIASEMTATRMAIETLQDSVVLLGKEPEEKFIVKPLSDIEDGDEPGIWLVNYDYANNRIAVQCSICGSVTYHPLVGILHISDTECKMCKHRMRPRTV